MYLYIADIKMDQVDSLFGTNMEVRTMHKWLKQIKYMMEGHITCQPLAKKRYINEIFSASVNSY